MRTTAILHTASVLKTALGAQLIVVGRRLFDFLMRSLAEGIIYPSNGVAVAIEDEYLSIAKVSKFLFRTRACRVSRQRLEGAAQFQPETLASTLAMALREMKEAGKSTTLVVPSSWILIKTVELPVSVRENLCDVVSFELDRLTPFSAKDAYYDFRVIGENEGRICLTLFAARADHLNSFLRAFKDYGIEVTRLTFESSGLSSLYSWASGKNEFVFLGKNSHAYHGGVTVDGSVISSFDLSFSQNGGGDKRLLAEMISPGILDRGGVLTRKAIAFGAIACVPEHERGLLDESRLGMKVSLVDPDQVKRRLHVVPKDTDMPFHALGAALDAAAAGAKGIDLLTKGKRTRRRVPFVLSIVLLLLVMMLFVLHVRAPLEYETKSLKELEHGIGMRKEAVRRTETLRKQVEVLRKEIGIVDDFKEKRPMALMILKELTGVLPKSAWLTRVRVTDSGVDLEGYATSAPGILPRLEQSKYLRKVEFSSPTIRDQRMNADRFVIRMEIEGSDTTTETGQKNEKK